MPPIAKNDISATSTFVPPVLLCHLQLGDERTDFEGMGAGVWGWNPQLGDESPPVRLARSGRNNFLKEKGFLKEHYSNKNFRTFIRLFFRWNFFRNSCFFRKNAYSKERTKTALFERTAFERKKWISKEHYSNKRPRPAISTQIFWAHSFLLEYI